MLDLQPAATRSRISRSRFGLALEGGGLLRREVLDESRSFKGALRAGLTA